MLISDIFALVCLAIDATAAPERVFAAIVCDAAVSAGISFNHVDFDFIHHVLPVGYICGL